MPAVRKTRKSAKAAADPYVKAETEASVKDETTTSGGEDKPKLNTSTSTYDRVQMFSDIIRGTKPDWPALAKKVNKSVTQCKDVWRKVILPALLDGREWSTSGTSGWDTKAKIAVLNTVLKGIDPDWNHVATAQGRTITQVKDMWRKVLQPRLLKGGTLS